MHRMSRSYSSPSAASARLGHSTRGQKRAWRLLVPRSTVSEAEVFSWMPLITFNLGCVLFHQRRQFRAHRGIFRIVGQILQLLRIRCFIEQHCAASAVVEFGVAPAFVTNRYALQ